MAKIKNDLQIIDEAIALKELEEKSRGWFLIKKYIDKLIKGNFEKMLKDYKVNDDRLKGGIKDLRKVKNYPKFIIDMAEDAKKRLKAMEKKE